MKKRKNEKAITLIALVVTIIILLILAGVTISSLTGSGLFNNTQLANKNTRYANAKEEVNLKLMEIQTECISGNKTYDISEIAKGMKTDDKISLERYYPKEVGKDKTNGQEVPVKIGGIVVSVEEYDEYKFLIGETGKIEKALEGKITESTSMENDFLPIAKFEKDNLIVATNPNGNIGVSEGNRGDWDVTPGQGNLGTAAQLAQGYYLYDNKGQLVQGAYQVPNTPSTQILANANVGDYIDLGTNYVDKSVQLADGTTPQTDWRVFYKTSDTVYLILSGYLPASVKNEERLDEHYYLKSDDDTCKWYFLSGCRNYQYIPMMKNQTLWAPLISKRLIDSGVIVNAAADLELWFDAWNNKHSTELSTGSWTYDLSTDTNGYNDTLFFPYKSAFGGADGYRLAQAWQYEEWAYYVKYNGKIDGTYGSDNNYSIRPIISIPINLKITVYPGVVVE